MGKERALFPPPAIPAGTMRRTVVEGSGTAPALKEAAPPSTLEAGVRRTEERGATSR